MLTKQILKATKLAQITNRNFGAIHKPAADQAFIAANVNKNTMVFDGLKASKNVTFELDNIYRHHNDLPLTQ